MTATTTATTTAAAPAATRARVGWGDLLWLAWRQHRWTVGGTAVVVVGLSALALGMAWHIDATGHVEHSLLFGEYGYRSVSQALVAASVLGGFVIAAFWAAPLLAREYEQRTHLVVWTQDVTPVRWLAGKVVLLGAAGAGLSAAYGAALVVLMNSVNANVDGGAAFMPFDSYPFEAVPHVQVGYALFGFALGLALSAFTRRTVASMGLALVGFFVVRGLVAGLWRSYYAPPLRTVAPYDPLPRDGGNIAWPARDAMVVDVGYLDAAGAEVDVDFNAPCMAATQDEGAYGRCLVDQGVSQSFVDYQPGDRVVPFQLVELGIFTVLAAGLLALTFWWVKRMHRV
ncbi:ABC transporter permease subunit [Actinosynnema sp. NPDC059797]